MSGLISSQSEKAMRVAVQEQQRQGGRIMQTADAWIATTALLYSAPLITHNISDYAHVSGLNLVSAT